MLELDTAEFHRTETLWSELDTHLVARSVLAGLTPARLWVDDARTPRAGFLWAGHRLLLGGVSDHKPFNRALRELILETLYPEALAGQHVMFTLYYAPSDRDAQITAMFEGKHPVKGWRNYLTCSTPPADWRAWLPAEFTLRAVEAAVLDQPGLEHVDQLREELCSERPSVDDFLQKSFGICLTQGHALAGWCLSEYNTGPRCEVGIETLPAYQRRGLGTIMTLALAEQAWARGLQYLGWHCWADNHASRATALKAGFVPQADYPVYFAWYNEADNLAGNGHVCLRRGQPDAALAWFERALTHAAAPAWAAYGAAQAAACLERPDLALAYLRQGLVLGYPATRAALEADPHLQGLHDRPGWRTCLEQLPPIA